MVAPWDVVVERLQPSWIVVRLLAIRELLTHKRGSRHSWKLEVGGEETRLELRNIRYKSLAYIDESVAMLIWSMRIP